MSIFAPNQACPEVFDEQFNLSLSKERELYSMLVLKLGRSPEEAIQVMGFLMWLQSEMCAKRDLVNKMFELTGDIVDEIANESVACLKCVHSDIMPFTEGVYEIDLLPNLVGENITLQFLHQHRFDVINGVKNMVNDVCVRAFKDIVAKVSKGKFYASSSGLGGNQLDGRNTSNGRLFATLDDDKGSDPCLGDKRSLSLAIFMEPGYFYKAQVLGMNIKTDIDGNDGSIDELMKIFTPLDTSNKFGSNVNRDNLGGLQLSNPLRNNNHTAIRGTSDQSTVFQPPLPYAPPNLQVATAIGYPVIPSANHQARLIRPPSGGIIPTGTVLVQGWPSPASAPTDWGNISPYAIPSTSRPGLGFISTGPSQQYYSSPKVEDNIPDDRTVFLTFSKGYPVSASEVGNFFTWKFGDVIEAIHMQNVRPTEQVLYAKMVCRTQAVCNVIIAGGKAKYNIHGRHVWARKYVKRNGL